MASYATIADMTARYPLRTLIQLTDDGEEPTNELGEANLQMAIDQADNVIDGYVSRYYKRLDATDPVPLLLTDIACKIAFHNLYKTDNPPEKAGKDHDAVMKQLDHIASGKIKIDQGEEKLPERDGLVLVESQRRLFDRDNLRNA